MEVNDELIDKLAHLAKLEVGDAERAGLKNELSKILAFVGKLNELDTDGVEPLIHMSDANTVLRADEAKEVVSHEEALKNAPSKDSDYFKVPKVLNK